MVEPIPPVWADPPTIRRMFQERAATLAHDLGTYIDDLTSGRMGPRAFVRRSMNSLQHAYYSVFSLGALSVDFLHVTTDEDLSAIQKELIGERRFLRSFASDLRAGTFEMDPGYRAGLYLKALRGVFEMGRIAAYPDRPLEWVLGDTDHCDPCFVASLNGPYRKDSLSQLSLPVLPGVPGSGEVCRGLTRCGCTVRRPGFPVNEDLQLDLRDILAEQTVRV